MECITGDVVFGISVSEQESFLLVCFSRDGGVAFARV